MSPGYRKPPDYIQQLARPGGCFDWRVLVWPDGQSGMLVDYIKLCLRQT